MSLLDDSGPAIQQWVLTYNNERNADGDQDWNRDQHQRAPTKIVHYGPGKQRCRRRGSENQEFVDGLGSKTLLDGLGVGEQCVATNKEKIPTDT